MPQKLGEPHVPDACDESLVDESLADQEPLIGAPKPRDHVVGVRLGREEIRSERAGRRVADPWPPGLGSAAPCASAQDKGEDNAKSHVPEMRE